MKLKYMNLEPMNNMTLGLIIIAMVPMLTGVIKTDAQIGLIPWIVCAYPVLIIALIYMIKNGQFVPATVNAICSVILLGQNLVNGLIRYGFVVNGQEVPAAVDTNLALASAGPMIAAGVVLLVVAFLMFKSKEVFAGVMFMIAGAGFISIGCAFSGLGMIFALIGGICIVLFGLFMFIPNGILVMLKIVKEAAMEEAKTAAPVPAE